MDPLTKIKQILAESNTEETSSETTGEQEISETNAQEILKGPGVDEAKKAANATGKATPPDKDSKGKSSTSKASVKSEESIKTKKPVLKTEEKEDDEEDEKEDKGEEKDKKKKEKKDVEEEFSVTEHVNALFNGENLSEEFKTRATTIFEAAISERENAIREQLSEEFETSVNTQVESIKNELTEQLENYLNYVVEEWTKENKVQIEQGLKLEIAESLMTGLRDVLLSHNIDVPESSVNIVEELSTKVDELQNSLNDEVSKNVELSKLVENLHRKEIVAEISEGLALTEADKFSKLAEDVSYNDDTTFRSKLKTLKESYFTKKSTSTSSTPNTKSTSEITDDETTETSSQPSSNSVLIESAVKYLKKK